MLEQLLDYRERQQMRKDRQQKRAMKYMAIFFVMAIPALVVGSLLEDTTPARPTTTTESHSAKTEAPKALCSEDFECSSLQEKYCLNVNQGFKEPQLTKRIEACLVETANWPKERFE